MRKADRGTCRLSVASACNGQYRYPVKATEKQPAIRKQRQLRTATHSVSTKNNRKLE
jgi:hypothetical protein